MPLHKKKWLDVIECWFSVCPFPNEAASRKIKRWFIPMQCVQGGLSALLHLYYKSHPETQLTSLLFSFIKITSKKWRQEGFMISEGREGNQLCPHEFYLFLLVFLPCWNQDLRLGTLLWGMGRDERSWLLRTVSHPPALLCVCLCTCNRNGGSYLAAQGSV